MDKKTDAEKNEIQTFDHGSPIDPRAEAMAAVVAQSRDAREESKAELLEQMGMEQDEDPMQAETEGEEVLANADVDEGAEIEQIDETIDNQEENSDNLDIEPETAKSFTLKVNGVEQEMSYDEAQVLLQKQVNADQLARQAAEEKRKYEQLNAQLQADPTPQADAEADAVDTQEALKEALEKVYDGDIDDAAQELSKVLAGGIRPGISKAEQGLTPEQVVEIVNARDDHRELQSAYKRFTDNADYKHITSDEALMGRVNTITEDLQKDPEFQKTSPTYDDYFNEAAKRTNDWIAKLTGKAPETPSEKQDEPNIDAERVERKRRTPKPPTARTVRRGPAPDASYPAKSREQVIADLAKARGQTNF